MKYIFFDIDGTLLDSYHGKTYVPDSTIKTIERLKENGHVVGIATGRQISTALPICKQLNIDNLVSDGGNGLMYKGDIKHIKPLDKDTCIKLSQELLDKGIPFAYMTDTTVNKAYATTAMLANQNITKLEQLDVIVDDSFDYMQEDAYKIYMAIRPGEEDKIKTVNVHKIMRYVEECLAYEPDDKYKGVKEFVELDGGNIEDIIFFGDGLNDIEMF